MGFLKSGITGGIKLLPLAIKYWWVVLTILVFAPSVIASINSGIEEGDLKQPMMDLGVLLVSADEVIYDKLDGLEFQSDPTSGIWEKIIFFLDLTWFIVRNFWRELWMMFFVFFLFFKIFRFSMGDDSKNLRAAIVSFLAMGFVQILVLGIPFRGLWTLAKFLVESFR